MNLHNVEFIKSAAAAQGLLHDGVPQIVFSGKSNVGKSSVINKLLNRKNIARVSSTPGKTVHINYFLIDSVAYFVDLPGYGYAKVAKTERARWAKLMEIYFSSAGHIALGVMIVDSRHQPTKDDVTMAEWFKATGCRMVVIANKIDKVKNSEKERNLETIRQTLELVEDIKIIPFSAEKGTNKELLIASIDDAVKGWNDVW
ncbi:MAG: ribosome biogenesis GTP-binding protein YihA/YsxC [Oscillospiraceae bacterium]|nr:ribosome biogenesis GTP-binding protein YihA/YsxC [Oscillospiraceae bacterium]